MTLAAQIFAQAQLLIQDAQDTNLPMLELLCRGAENSLKKKLRDGITPQDCKADFVAAASLYALAALSEVEDMSRMEHIQAGDLTIRRNSPDSAACCLRYQAEMMIAPYMKDGFSFLGV
ncbi:MAG: hypothetical protein E7454_04420 [Ruminococcaceae bacterium]|nr:hypothetical protein [Oscillospiraceae bacterium]